MRVHEQGGQSLPTELFMDIDRSSPVPLYFQIASKIEQAIVDGVLAPGTRLENELALRDRLNLSRPTIRRALQDLVDKGLLVRRRGIGTQVVRRPVTRKVELTSLYDDLVTAEKQPSTTLLTREVITAGKRIAETLSLPADSLVLHIRRIRYADGTPLALMENYLPPQFAGISEEDLRTRGLYQLLRERRTLIRIAHQRIGAREATAEESRHLEIKAHGAVLAMDRTAFDDGGVAVEFGQHCYRPDLYHFEMTLVDS